MISRLVDLGIVFSSSFFGFLHGSLCFLELTETLSSFVGIVQDTDSLQHFVNLVLYMRRLLDHTCNLGQTKGCLDQMEGELAEIPQALETSRRLHSQRAAWNKWTVMVQVVDIMRDLNHWADDGN